MSEDARAILFSFFFLQLGGADSSLLFFRTSLLKRQSFVCEHVCTLGLCVTRPWEVSSGSRNLAFCLPTMKRVEDGEGQQASTLHNTARSEYMELARFT